MRTKQKIGDLGGMEQVDGDMLTAFRVLGNIVTGDPKLTQCNPVPNNGDLAFRVPLNDLIQIGRKAELRRMLKQRFWCDFLGETLLRRKAVEAMS